jgi:hypothetical protein
MQIGYINASVFQMFSAEIYGQQLSKKEIQDFYILLDHNESGRISIEEFFNVLQIIDENKKYAIDWMRTLQVWEDFREFMNRRLKLRKILDSK